MRYGIKITGSSNGEGVGIRTLLMLLGLIASSLSLGMPGVRAQDDKLPLPTKPDLARQRCEAKFPEKARQIRAEEHLANVDRDNIRKAETQIETLQRQAERNEETAKGLIERAKREREKKNIAQANKDEQDAKIIRAQANTLLIQAEQHRVRARSLRRSVTRRQATIDQLLGALFKACGLPVSQGGGNQGGNQGGNTGGNPGGTGNSGSGSGNTGNTSGGAENSGAGNTGNGNLGGGGGAQNKRPIDIDKMPDGPPAVIHLPNGIKKFVYKNKDKQVFKEEVHDKSGKVAEYNVNKIYPNGQTAEDSSLSFGNPGNDYGFITRNVKYDSDGNLVKTDEMTSFKNPPVVQTKTTTYNGGAFPSNETTITVDKDGKKKTEECKDFGGKYGFNTKVVTENGETKTYVRDENGNWVPKEDKKPEPPKINPPKPQPPKPNPVPKPAPENKVENQGDMRCLAGTWHSTAVELLSEHKGGEGIILVVKANGETMVDYKVSLKARFPSADGGIVEEIRTDSGMGSGTIRVESGVITVVRSGPANISHKIGDKQLAAITSGLGMIFISPPATFTCGEATLTIKSISGEIFKFQRK
jgi:hypothetical protein